MSSVTPLRVPDAPVQKLLKATFDRLVPLAQATALESSVRNHRDGCADIQLFGANPDDQVMRTRSRQTNKPDSARAVSFEYWQHGDMPDNSCHQHQTVALLCVKEVTTSVLHSGNVSSTTEETSMSLLRFVDGSSDPGQGLMVVNQHMLELYLPNPVNAYRTNTSANIDKDQLTITALDELEEFLDKFATIATEALTS